MISNFKTDHPIVWRTAFIVLPFVAGIAAYFAVAAIAPSYPQSIRDQVDANLKPLRELPIVTRLLGPIPSTPTESPIDTLMKHYSALKSEENTTPIVNDSAPALIESTTETMEPASERVTWNNTNAAVASTVETPDVVTEPDGPFVQLADSADANARIRAIEALSNASNRHAVRTCIEGLVDEDPIVRRHASRAIMRAPGKTLYREWAHILLHGPPELLQVLDAEVPELQAQLEPHALSSLASGESARLEKMTAIYTLGRIRSDAALPMLAGYAWSNDLEIGQTATAAIAETRSPKAVGALIDLTEHYDADVRWYAVNGLGLVQGEDALAAIEAVLESGLEPVQEIRLLAINHLAQAGDPASVAPLVDAISRFPSLREDAMYALSQITGIDYFTVPYEWDEWYKEWSATPEAQAAQRRRRIAPATQVAAIPAETALPEPTAPVARPDPQSSASAAQPALQPGTPVEQATTPPAPAEAVPEPVAASQPASSAPRSSRKPFELKKTGTSGGFGTSDLSPAELMRQGGFGADKP